MAKRLAFVALFVALVAAACGDDDQQTTETTPTTAATTTSTADQGPALGPAALEFDAQESDGTTIVIASVTLPSPGFIAIHANNEGAPGPVIGHSDLLPAGTTSDVTVTLDTPLAATDLVFPMVHIDVNENGEYDFAPPDVTTDSPGQTADGSVAVVGAEVTVVPVSAAGAKIDIAGFSFGAPITVATGQEVTIRNRDAVPHTWTSSQSLFNSGVLSGDAEFVHIFDTAGEYGFFCEIHPEMTGSITVTG